jgi:hypothetical protein
MAMNSKLIRSLLLGAGLVMVLSAVAEAAGPYQFFSVTPCRIVDTRRPNGVTGGPSLGNQVVRNFPIGGQCGVPSTAKAAVLNVTIASPTNAGYLILYPFNTTQPLVSTINWAAGEPALANGAIVPLSADPTFQLAVYSELYGGGNVHLILDVTGYFQ